MLVKPIDDAPSIEDKDDEIQMETPKSCGINRYSPSRRSAKSKLGLISVNQGFHSVKLPPQRRRRSNSPEMVFNTEQVMYAFSSKSESFNLGKIKLSKTTRKYYSTALI